LTAGTPGQADNALIAGSGAAAAAILAGAALATPTGSTTGKSNAHPTLYPAAAVSAIGETDQTPTTVAVTLPPPAKPANTPKLTPRTPLTVAVESSPPVLSTTTTTTVAPLAPKTVVGRTSGIASWLNIKVGTCANNDAPMGAVLTVTNSAGVSVTCVVVSRGPFVPGRVVDLAKGTFAVLSPTSQGLVNVSVSW